MAYYHLGEDPQDKDPCEICYDLKGVSYQKCRDLPFDPDPAKDRQKRVTCFREADKALVQCLTKSGCAGGKTVSSIGAEALIGAGVVWMATKLLGG